MYFYTNLLMILKIRLSISIYFFLILSILTTSVQCLTYYCPTFSSVLVNRLSASGRSDRGFIAADLEGVRAAGSRSGGEGDGSIVKERIYSAGFLALR